MNECPVCIRMAAAYPGDILGATAAEIRAHALLCVPEMPDGSRVPSITERLSTTEAERDSWKDDARTYAEWAITEAVHGRPETLDAIRALIRAHDDEGNNEPEGED